ncbi:MAG TPA: glutathione S-transferase family protein [Geminicoccaceae bacterium]|nr:glutathione S-transferase family protein [Geminicoccus sp.]HMU52269.1 glutathione S-transferase family protein [Geminicoccaceae bacterium]
MYHLITTKGCGSAIVEAALELSGLPYEIEELDYETPGQQRDKLRSINPLGQVPTLLLPGGALMTESAAMILHIADQRPEAGLVPPADDAARPAFLRWLVFLVAAIYPTFTYGDDTSRWVDGETAGAKLKATTNQRREDMWRYVEGEVRPDPWMLGGRFSALDLYVSVMTHWRPRRPWFAEHCPKLSRVALRVDALPPLAEVWVRNFG